METNYSFIRDDETFANFFRDINNDTTTTTTAAAATTTATTTSAAASAALKSDSLKVSKNVENKSKIATKNDNADMIIDVKALEKKKHERERRKREREDNKFKDETDARAKDNQHDFESVKLKELKQLQLKKLKPVDKDIMVIILDHDVQQPYLRRKPELFTQVLNAVTMLGSSHLLGRSQNELAFVACSRLSVNLVQPDRLRLNLRCLENSLDAFDFADYITKVRFTELMRQDARAGSKMGPSVSLLAGAIGKALCYIQRRRREINLGMAKGLQSRIEARVLIVTATEPSSNLLTNYMHMFNGAKSSRVALDVCILDRGHTISIWRQATDVTGGFYYATNDFDGLLTRLLGLFLMSPVERFQFNYPEQPLVDYRPSCVCHKNVLDIGYVCSACLSVHCKYTPICFVCDCFFKPPPFMDEYMKNNKKSKGRKRMTSL